MTDLDKKVKKAVKVSRLKVNTPSSGASYTSGFNLENNPRFLKFLRDEMDESLIGIVVIPADIQQPDGSVDPVMPVRIVGTANPGGSNSSTITSAGLTVSPQLQDNNTGAWGNDISYGANPASTSTANATQTKGLELRNLNTFFAFKMTTSAGTATVTVNVSIDNVTFTTIGAFAAAANTVATFRASAAGSAPDVTGGAYTADATNGSLHPLAFKFVQLVVGAAGGGNTTTLTMSVH